MVVTNYIDMLRLSLLWISGIRVQMTNATEDKASNRSGPSLVLMLNIGKTRQRTQGKIHSEQTRDKVPTVIWIQILVSCLTKENQIISCSINNITHYTDMSGYNLVIINVNRYLFPIYWYTVI